jgi:sigma-B regulation protein RsbU (phosphoserine phosphatase)
VAASREAVVLTRWDRNFDPTLSFILSGAGSALCVPLVGRGTVIGVLYLDRLKGTQPFSETDIELLGPIAGLIALKIENIQLLEAYLAGQLDRRDMEIAEEIQRNLFPRDPVNLAGYDIDGFTRPCRQVGGDYVDFAARGDREVLFALGDVSGKGLSAALYMVGVLATLRSQMSEALEPAAMMAKLERYVTGTFRPDHFLTLVLGKLDVPTGGLTYCNAGHLPPLVFTRDGNVRELEAADPALNIVPGAEFRSFEYALAPGDLFLVYTDGVIEEANALEEQFGVERLTECVREHRGRDLASIRKEICAAVDGFSAGEGLRDDLSLILLRREEAS